jgi:hypothetical protein
MSTNQSSIPLRQAPQLSIVERILRSPSYRTIPIVLRLMEAAGIHRDQRHAHKALWYIQRFERVRERNQEDDTFPGPHSEAELFDISNLTRAEEWMTLEDFRQLYPIREQPKTRRLKRAFKKCKQCGARFLARRRDQDFDTRRCALRYWRKNAPSQSVKPFVVDGVSEHEANAPVTRTDFAIPPEIDQAA